MSNPELKLRITGDLSSIQQALKGLGQGIDATKAKGAALGDGMRKGVDTVAASVKVAGDALRGLEVQYNRVENAARRAQAAGAGAPAGPKGDPGGAVARQQVADRDEALRILEINRRADALEARLAATRTKGAAASRAAASATNLQANATRGLNREIAMALPQLTDIGVGLASGQSPFMVAIQQGGQLRDIFGGIGPAIRAVGGAVLSIVNPLTITVGVIAGLGYAYLKGQEEGMRFNRILLETGNTAGITSGQLGNIARRLDDLEGSTRSSASNTLAIIAETGKFTADQFEMVARAAEEMRNSSGKDVEATVAEFAKIADDPVAALDLLSQKYNIVNGDIREQVTRLQEQGRTQEAVTILMNAYASAIEQRAPKIVENLGYIERGWRMIKNAASEAGDAILSVGRTQTSADLKAERQDLLNTIANPWNDIGGEREQARRRLAEVNKQLAELKVAEDEAQKKAAADAARRRADQLSSELARDAQQYETKEAKRARLRIAAMNKADAAIAAARAAGDAKAEASAKASRDQIVAGIDKEAEDEAKRKDAAASRLENAARRKAEKAAREAANIAKVDAELVRDATQRALAELDRMYGEGLISVRDYFAKKKELQLQAVDAEIVAAQKERDLAVNLDDRKRAEAEIIKLQRERADIGTRAAQEQSVAERELGQELDRIRARLAEDKGDVGATNRVQLEQERDALLRKFQTNPGASELVKQLFDVELARARADAIAGQADKLTGYLDTRAAYLASQAQVHAITHEDAEKQIQASRAETIRQLEELLVKAEAALNASPSPETLAQVEQLKTKINELNAAQNTLAAGAQQAGYNALRGLFTDLATGAKSFGDAVRDAVVNFVQGLGEMAAAALAQQAMDAIMGFFNGGAGASKGPDIGQAAAAGAAYAAPITTASAALATASSTGAAAMQTVAIAIPTAINTASAGLSASGSVLISSAVSLQSAAVALQAAAAALAAANAMRAGAAHTGAVVGAGFPAHRTVSPSVFIGAPRFHSGGVVGLKADEVPAILQTGERVLSRRDARAYEAAQRGAGGGRGMRVVNVLDPKFVADQLNSAAGDDLLINFIGRNASRVRQVLG